MAERTEFPATHDKPAPPGADVYDPTGSPYGPQPNGVDAAAGGADSSPYDTEATGDRGVVAAHDKYLNRSGQNEPAGQPSQLARD
jgi:hypothetical protein